MKVTLADNTHLEFEDEPFADGTSGVVYADKVGKYVVKLYKPLDDPQRQAGFDAQKEAALQKIISSQYSVVLNEPYWDDLFTWPKAIVKQPKLGFIMPRAPKGMEKLHWFLSQKTRSAFAAKHGAQQLGKWSDSLELAIQMARVVRRLHMRGLCHSDLSFNNFLVAPAQQRVVLIDCDGLVVPGPYLKPDVDGTFKCMAPELAAQTLAPVNPKIEPSVLTDLHALATLVYWLLLQRHPLIGDKKHSADTAIDEALALGQNALFVENHLDRSNQLKNLGVPYTTVFTPAVQEIVRRAFIDGLHQPERRPTAVEWERALERMRDALVPCANKKCGLDKFVLQANRPICPLCSQPVSSVNSMPLLNFYRPRGGMKGHFSNDQGHVLVGQPDLTLHLWHATGGLAGDPSIDGRPKAEFHFQKQKWYLKNLDLPELSLLGRGRGYQAVPPGQEIELSDGARLLLGPPEHCRMAYVQMIKAN